MWGKILVVDDNVAFRSEFCEYFQEYDIIEASSGEEALAKLKKPNDIDLVILDVCMPGIGGIEALKEIRKISPDTGIIILTGYSSTDIAIEALRAHADDYIEKPLDIKKTYKIIERVLDTRRKDRYSRQNQGDGRMERVKFFLRRNAHKRVSLKDVAEEVCLSPKYLSRLFKQTVNMGFNEYKLSLKMDRAKYLLSKTSYNVNQITEKMGYQNAESFIRQFKKNTGFTPTEYRHKNKNKAKNNKSNRAARRNE